MCVAVVGLLFLGLAACGDSNESVDDAVDSAREQAADAVGSAGARAAAEAMRVALQAENLEANQTVRDVAVLQESAADVPGSPDVSGIADTDGDGKDDDGKVQLAVGDQTACVTVEDNGDVSVSSEACSA